MSSNAEKRLLKDLKKMHDFQQQQESIQATPDEDSLFAWDAIIFGPEDTIWEGGIFSLKLEFTEDYPNKAPKVRFLNKMFHPNIYADGSICLDILQHAWSPVYDVASILTSIQSLLTDPNVNAPANNTAAVMYTSNNQEYCSRVRQVVEQSQAEDDDDDDDDADADADAEGENEEAEAAADGNEASQAQAASVHQSERDNEAEEVKRDSEDEDEGTMNVDEGSAAAHD